MMFMDGCVLFVRWVVFVRWVGIGGLYWVGGRVGSCLYQYVGSWVNGCASRGVDQHEGWHVCRHTGMHVSMQVFLPASRHSHG